MWASQQHKYLKHGGREPVASKKMTLGQVVPNFTEQVVSSKILRIVRWKFIRQNDLKTQKNM